MSGTLELLSEEGCRIVFCGFFPPPGVGLGGYDSRTMDNPGSTEQHSSAETDAIIDCQGLH